MEVNVSKLLARRVELLAEVARLDAAIKAASAGVYEVETHRNIRNTFPLTVDPRASGVLVFADEGLTRLAREQAHSGFVSGADAAYLEVGGYVGPNLILKAVK